MTTMGCSFCLENDHYLRNKTIVTCPKLLATQCNICYKFGHTTTFCKEKSEKSEKPKTIYKRINYSTPQSQIVKSKKTDFITVASRFAALEVKEYDFDNTSEYDCDDEIEPNIEEIEKIKNEESKESDDDELPPVSAIVWGKGFASKYKTTKWSD